MKQTDNLESQISIVKMTERHIDAVFNLAQESRLSFWSVADYQKEIVRNDAVCLAAELNKSHKELIAFIIARLIMQENCVEVNNIAVNLAYRRLGIGKKLFQELINYCISNNLEIILLEVRISNDAAIKFYRDIDFKVIGIRKNFYQFPDENAVTMVKYLK
jgi:ribosomal-protein-alanine N-acetyltransferase